MAQPFRAASLHKRLLSRSAGSSPSQTVQATEAGPGGLTRREFRLVIAALVVAMMLSALDQSIVNTALPRMVSDLGGLEHISWVVTAFMLGSTVSTPLYGKLSDMYGRRRVFIVSIGLLLIGSALCGIAQSMLQLVVFRGLQGVGGGGLLILSQSVIADLVGPRERARYLGVVTGAMAVSSVAGPLIGGTLTDALSWRWVFYVNLPVGGLALALIMAGLKVEVHSRHRHDIDVIGALLLVVSAICALLLLSWGGSAIGWLSPQALALGAAAAIGSVLFYHWEARAKEPIVDLNLLRTPGLLNASMASSTISFAMMGLLVFVPLYFQLVLGLSSMMAGLMLIPQIGATLVSSLVFGSVSARYGRPKLTLIAGVVLQIIGLVGILAVAWADLGLFGFLAALTVFGLGQGIAMPSATLIVQALAGPDRVGMATAAIAFIRSMGGSVGIAVSGGVMSALLSARLAKIPVAGLQGGKLGLKAIATLPGPARYAVLQAYHGAIAGTFAMSLGIMVLALVVSSIVPGHALSDEKTANT